MRLEGSVWVNIVGSNWGMVGVRIYMILILPSETSLTGWHYPITLGGVIFSHDAEDDDHGGDDVNDDDSEDDDDVNDDDSEDDDEFC